MPCTTRTLSASWALQAARGRANAWNSWRDNWCSHTCGPTRAMSGRLPLQAPWSRCATPRVPNPAGAALAANLWRCARACTAAYGRCLHLVHSPPERRQSLRVCMPGAGQRRAHRKGAGALHGGDRGAAVWVQPGAGAPPAPGDAARPWRSGAAQRPRSASARSAGGEQAAGRGRWAGAVHDFVHRLLCGLRRGRASVCWGPEPLSTASQTPQFPPCNAHQRCCLTRDVRVPSLLHAPCAQAARAKEWQRLVVRLQDKLQKRSAGLAREAAASAHEQASADHIDPHTAQPPANRQP